MRRGVDLVGWCCVKIQRSSMQRVRQYVAELTVNIDLCKAETPAPVSCFIYRCLVFPLLCYSSTGLHLNYTLGVKWQIKLYSKKCGGNVDQGCVWVKGMQFANLPLGLWIHFVEIVTGQSGEMHQITLLQPRAHNGLETMFHCRTKAVQALIKLLPRQKTPRVSSQQLPHTITFNQ